MVHWRTIRGMKRAKRRVKHEGIVQRGTFPLVDGSTCDHLQKNLLRVRVAELPQHKRRTAHKYMFLMFFS